MSHVFDSAWIILVAIVAAIVAIRAGEGGRISKPKVRDTMTKLDRITRHVARIRLGMDYSCCYWHWLSSNFSRAYADAIARNCQCRRTRGRIRSRVEPNFR